MALIMMSMESTESHSALLRRITINPEICHGKPTVRGLRYPVESLLEYLAAGDTTDEILSEFPDLEKEDLQACILYATRSLKLKATKDLFQNQLPAFVEALGTCSLVELEKRDTWISAQMGAKIDLSDKDAVYDELDKE